MENYSIQLLLRGVYKIRIQKHKFTARYLMILRPFKILTYNRLYGHNAEYLRLLNPITVMSNMYGLYHEKCIKELLQYKYYLYS